jgi:CHAD domain-containing protein
MAGRHRRMLDRGCAIGPDSPPKELHALRIQAKKLRYLLDAVRPLYDEAEVERPLAVLKKLQDVLGGYHDAMVQQELLRAAGLRMAERGLADASMLMSLGRMLDRLALRGARQRDRFAKRWAAFDDGPVRERFGALCARHADDAA